MSFKKYIEQIKSQQKTSKPLIKKSRRSLGVMLDRGEAAKIKQKNKDRYFPPVDFATSSNFAFYGLAEEYYTNAIDSISNYYPYDGTTTDKELWHYSASFLENYIFDHEYPRTNGNIVFSSEGWSTQNATEDGYGEPTTKQYILFNGGLNRVGQVVNNTDFTYDLKYGHDNGNCVEFWVKKSGFLSSLTEKEVVIDIWNSSSAAASNGRFTVELTASTNVLNVMIASGTVRATSQLTSIASGSLVDNGWHHVALNFSYGASNVAVESYLDGVYKGTDTIAGAINEVTGNFIAAIGSLVTNQTGTSTTALGWGKLSGSLDDFRFWKKERTSEEISIFSKQSLDGGAVTGSTNIDLGVYYKFNEGITTTAATDATILDYSGFINNGTFTGYVASARNTDSAFVASGRASKEFKDPILYTAHPSVTAYRDRVISSGSVHDTLNNNSLYNTLPDWIISEDQDNSGELKKLTQIMASALDELYLEIKTLSSINLMEYQNDKIPKNRFAQQALNSRGLLIGRILEDNSVLGGLYSSGDDGLFLQKLEDVKQIIYTNLYNNSTEIFKTKGTVESLRNALRCFGVDNELINLSVYEDNSIIKLDDKRELYAEKHKFINFSTISNNDAVVFPSLSGALGTPYISGTYGTADPIESRLANTYECQVFLPKYPEFGKATTTNFVGISSSIFGVHGIVATSSIDNGTTFLADDAGFQVYAVRDSLITKKVKFVLTSSVAAAGSNIFPSIETGFFEDSYDNETWTLAVTVKPIGYKVGDKNQSLQTGSGSYIVNFRGYNAEDERVYHTFDLSSSFHSERAIKLLSQNRKPYYGANRTNFTGSVLNKTDLNIGFFRVWLDDLTGDELISHAKDPRNFGRAAPFENFLPISTRFSGTSIPKINSLIMNIGADNVSTSDSSGEFILADLSSGSYKTTGIQELNSILGGMYQSKGFSFAESSTSVYTSRFFTVGKTINPENFGELTGVRILTEDDTATKSMLKAKLAYFTIEKSAQQAINRDIISFFSSLSGFNELIGNPVNKYRLEYKELKKLATEYFSTVISKKTSAAFFEYYKWLDNAINDMLINLLPATMNGSDKVYNVIESHVLERNKYQYKLPTIEFRTPDPEAIASGSNNISWKFAHHPLTDAQRDNCYWWKYKAERDNTTFGTSLSAGALESRNQILSVSKQLQVRRQNSPVKESVSISREIHGGINFTPNKRLDFYKGVLHNSSSVGGFTIMETTASSIQDPQACDDDLDTIEKRKLPAQVSIGTDTTAATTEDKYKFDLVAPFNLYSSSVGATGYADNTFNATNPNELITNLHHDTFGPDSEQPLQGTFTAYRVGGSKSRKVRLTDTGDRPERFVVGLTQSNRIVTKTRRAEFGYAEPVDQFYQDPPARSPVNIKNIQTVDKAVGNYTENYEVVQTSGRSINNLALRELTGVVGDLVSPYISGTYDYPMVTRTSNKTVFVERFSAPGGPDTAGAFLDPVNTEVSVYNSLNYRNSVVRDVLNLRMKKPSAFGGYTSGSSDLSASIHKVQRNTTKKIKYSTGTTTLTGTVSDSGFISRGIPARDAGYAWITGSAQPSSYYAIESGFATGSDEILFCSSSIRDFESSDDYEINFAGYYAPGEFVAYEGYHITVSGNYLVNAPENYLGKSAGLVDNIDVYFTNIVSNGHNWNSWRQIRGDRNVVTRHLRRNNIITYQKRPQNISGKASPFTEKETGYLESVEPAVAAGNAVLIIADLQDDSINNSTLFALPYNSQKRHFFSNLLEQVVLTENQKNNKSAFEEFYDFYTSPYQDTINKEDISFVKYTHQIYPLQKFSYLGRSLIRDTFTQTWAPTRRKRSLLKLFDDTAASTDYKDINSISSYNQMGFDLVYQGPDATSSIMLGDAISPSINVLDSVYNSAYDGNIVYSSSVATMPYGSQTTASVGGIRYFDLRTTQGANNVDLPNTDGTASWDGVSANYLSFGILRDIKSVLNRWICHVPNGSTGSALPDSGIEGFPSHTYGPLLEMPSLYHSDTADPPVVVKFNADFFEAWTAPTTYGKGPSYYNDHKEFSEYIKLVGKDHTLIPEYRISERLSSLVVGSNPLNSDAVSSRSIRGSSAAADNISSYEDGDLLLNFVEFSSRHEGFMKPTKLKLRIDAITKLLPYEGFYPAERTVQIAELFSSSLASSHRLRGTDPTFRTAMQPLFAPGILYNSIKTGVGISYGMFTASYSTARCPIDDNNPAVYPNGYSELTIDSAAGFTKLSFEELVTLDIMTRDSIDIYDMYPADSMSMNSTASIYPTSSPLYQMAMSNFLASTADFCLSDNGLTTVSSKEQKELQEVTTSESYSMAVTIQVATASTGFPVQDLWNMAYSSNWCAGWGPAVSGALTAAGDGFSTDQLWRPQWAYGSASVVLEWNPTTTGKPRITQIQKEATASYFDSGDTYTGASYSDLINDNKPNIGDSINLFLSLKKPQWEKDPTTGQQTKEIQVLDDSNTVWVVQPKWETPFLTRTAVDAAPTAGIWKSFCEIPNPNTNGASFSLQFKDVVGKSSLKDLVGFPEKVELGKLSKTTKIEESIVCIPYYEQNNKKQFFTITQTELRANLIEGTKELQSGREPNEWYKLSGLLDKYVFPPAFDFSRNKNQMPLGMLVKEYEVALDEEDISLFWQNLPPKPLGNFDLETSYLEIDLEKTSMFKDIAGERLIKWVVFKVKKRAKTNYFAETANNPAFADLSFNTLNIKGTKFSIDDFSYNYPYDFCSLVETAKITVEVDFVKKADE